MYALKSKKSHSNHVGLTMSKLTYTEFKVSKPLKIGKKFKPNNEVEPLKLTSGMAYKRRHSFKSFYNNLITSDDTQAFGYGVCNHDEIEITTKKRETESKIARTKENFYFDSCPGIYLFDYDYSSYGPIITPSQFRKILLEFGVPKSTAYCWRESSSAFMGSKSFHFYLPILDMTDAIRFSHLFEKWLIISGYGYIKLDKVMNPRINTIIDRTVISPERNEYLNPIVHKCYHDIYRDPEHDYHEGTFLDTSLFQPSLVDLNVYDETINRLKKDSIEWVAKKQREYDSLRIKEAIASGLTKQEALKQVSTYRRSGYRHLPLDTLIMFEHETITIREALELGYHNVPCRDPHSNKHIGQARFYKTHIRSFYYNNTYRYIDHSKPDCIYLDDLPSTGKSFWFFNQVKPDRKIVIALPSAAFQKDYSLQLKDYNVRVISHLDCTRKANGKQETVTDLIIKAVEDSVNIIIITHNALTNCIHKSLFLTDDDEQVDLSDYDLVIDENFFNDLHKFYTMGSKYKEFMAPDGGFHRAFKIVKRNNLRVVKVKDAEQYASICQEVSKVDGLKAKSAIEMWKDVGRDNREVTIHEAITKKKIRDPETGKVTEVETSKWLFASTFRLNLLASFKSFTLMSACISQSITFCGLQRHFNMIKHDLDSSRKQADFSLLNVGIITDEYDSYTQSIRKDSIFRKWHKDVYAQEEWWIEHKAQEHVQWCMEQFGFRDLEYTCRMEHKQKYRSIIGRLANEGDWYPGKDGEKLLFRLFGDSGKRNGISQDDDAIFYGTKLPVNSAGSNRFDHVRACAIVACLNPSPMQNSFYQQYYTEYKHSKEYNWVWIDRIGLPSLQAVTRMCIRKVGNTLECWVIFFDKQTSNYVRKMLRNEPIVMGIPGADEWEIAFIASGKAINLKTHFKNGKKRMTEEQKKEKARLRVQKHRSKKH